MLSVNFLYLYIIFNCWYVEIQNLNAPAKKGIKNTNYREPVLTVSTCSYFVLHDSYCNMYQNTNKLFDTLLEINVETCCLELMIHCSTWKYSWILKIVMYKECEWHCSWRDSCRRNILQFAFWVNTTWCCVQGLW